jgi:wobble nucleotide-excising tRNase
MIKKIVAIRNVGRLEKCNAQGDLTFRKLTLIFAENGRGKTTLTDVFRSLSTGNAEYILGRKTLGSAFPPSALVLIDDNKAVTFKDGAWDGAGPRLSIYDSTFIHENVYAGDHIDHEHKKNLYRVIVGEAGVSLARKVDEYDGRIRDANKEVTAKAAVVRASLPAGLKLETFLALQADPDVTTKIATKQAEIAALDKAEEIKDKTSIASVALAHFPANFETLLAKVLENVSKDAETAVKKHLATHAKPGGEEWVAQGLHYANGKDCPFCGQPTEGVDLIADYQKYFSQSYAAFKKELAALQQCIENALGETALLGLQKTLSDNAALVSFWSQFVEVDLPELTFTELQTVVGNLRTVALARLKTKLASPLDPVTADEAFGKALTDFQAAATRVQDYASAVTAANVSITAKKKETEGGNLTRGKSDLGELQAVQKRYGPSVDAACSAYSGAVDAKTALDDKKAAAKTNLDSYSGTVVAQYEKRINKLLQMFGAGFRIGETKTRYVGGNVSSTFHIVINNVPVALGDADTPAAQACFKNTLSAGDRSTLALAFFIAQLESDPKLADTVVVFDDPLTSQDRSRRLQTKQEVCRLAGTARQVIVMSHDPGFLKLIQDSVPSGMARTLQFVRLGEKNSTIGECDIDDIVRGDYFDNYNILHKYLYNNDGPPRLVVRSIRPLLEAYMRVKLPRDFKPNEWLGDMIGKIRDSAVGSQLDEAKAILGELEVINEYSKRYHHDEGAGVEADPIDDGELQSFIRRTLDVVGGF